MTISRHQYQQHINIVKCECHSAIVGTFNNKKALVGGSLIQILSKLKILGCLIILGVLSLAFQSRLDLIARGLAKTFAGKVKIYLGRARDRDTERLLGSDGNIDVY